MTLLTPDYRYDPIQVLRVIDGDTYKPPGPGGCGLKETHILTIFR